MKKANQNKVLGAFGIILIAIGLLGYTGALAKIRNQATVIIETNGTITDISASSDSLTGLPPQPYKYWQEDMSNWGDLTEGTKIDAGKPVNFLVTWRKTSSSTVIGHAELTVTLPDGSTVSPPAIEGQDSPDGHMVEFENVPGMQGDYKLHFDITGEYKVEPAGYFTINGENAAPDATITLHTNDLTFRFFPTQEASRIESVIVDIDPVKGAKGENKHSLILTKQQTVSPLPTYKATDTLSDGTYEITGRFYSNTGKEFTAMSIKSFSVGKEKGNRALWFAPVMLGLVAVIGAFERERNLL